MRFPSFPSFTAGLLNVQYTIGYVAAGFLVSVPIQLLWVEKWEDLWGSLLRGILCLVLFFLLWPILRYYDWGKMKLPEFKLFEMQVTRNAALVSLALLLLSFVDERVGSRQMLWLLFLLEGIAYVKIKAHTLIFREFYAIEQKTHQREWYDELRHGFKAQASQVGGQLRFQAREVQGQMRARVRRLARWAGVSVVPVDEAGPVERVAVVAPAPCRYQGRSALGRVVLTSAQAPPPAATDDDGEAHAALEEIRG